MKSRALTDPQLAGLISKSLRNPASPQVPAPNPRLESDHRKGSRWLISPFWNGSGTSAWYLLSRPGLIAINAGPCTLLKLPPNAGQRRVVCLAHRKVTCTLVSRGWELWKRHTTKHHYRSAECQSQVEARLCVESFLNTCKLVLNKIIVFEKSMAVTR